MSLHYITVKHSRKDNNIVVAYTLQWQYQILIGTHLRTEDTSMIRNMYININLVSEPKFIREKHVDHTKDFVFYSLTCFLQIEPWEWLNSYPPYTLHNLIVLPVYKLL